VLKKNLNKKILISHRGNTKGLNPDLENNPKYIESAIKLGFDVEVDVWFLEGEYFLGHDNPQYKTNLSFLERLPLWCHAKNVNALSSLISNPKIHCFWHQEDDVTLTSRGFLWTYPGKKVTEKSICVLPEEIPGLDLGFKTSNLNLNFVDFSTEDLKSCIGYCSDFITLLEDY